mgnify:CR=1 FL=1
MLSMYMLRSGSRVLCTFIHLCGIYERVLCYVLGTDVPLRMNCTIAFLPSSLSGASICIAPRTSFLWISRPRDLACCSNWSGTYGGTTSSLSPDIRKIGGSERGIGGVASLGLWDPGSSLHVAISRIFALISQLFQENGQRYLYGSHF